MFLTVLILCNLYLLEAGEVDHPVDLEARFDWYCRPRDGRYWWPGHTLDNSDNDCYRYRCERGEGIKRYWKLEILSHCCGRY